MYTKLNLINHSYDIKDSNIVVFSQNVNPMCKKPVNAWKVITDCEIGSTKVINFPKGNKISVTDRYGNISEEIQYSNGDFYEIISTRNGNDIRNTIKNSKEYCFRIENKLPNSSVNVDIYKDEYLFKQLVNIKPNTCVNVDFINKIYIGIVHKVGENNIVKPCNLLGYCTELSIKNIKSADIVLIGGGYGINTKGYNFILDNVEMN